MHGWRMLLCIVFATGIVGSCATTGVVEESYFRGVPALDLCEIRSNIDQHVGSYARMEATYYTNFDSETYLYSAGCPGLKLDVRNLRLPDDGGETLQKLWGDQAASCANLPGQNCPLDYRVRALVAILSPKEGRYGVHLIEVFEWERQE